MKILLTSLSLGKAYYVFHFDEYKRLAAYNQGFLTYQTQTIKPLLNEPPAWLGLPLIGRRGEMIIALQNPIKVTSHHPSGLSELRNSYLPFGYKPPAKGATHPLSWKFRLPVFSPLIGQFYLHIHTWGTIIFVCLWRGSKLSWAEWGSSANAVLSGCWYNTTKNQRAYLTNPPNNHNEQCKTYISKLTNKLTF